MKRLKTLHVTTREQWRAWLARHHDDESEVWLVYYKKNSGKPRIAYNDAVEEALCFGWIDSLVKSIDDQKFAQKFTPRKNSQMWSAINKQRVAQLVAEGRMTAAGMEKLGTALEKSADSRAGNQTDLHLPPGFERRIRRDREAWEFFQSLAPSYKKRYVLWIMTAKKEETRLRRLDEAILILSRKEKLGLK